MNTDIKKLSDLMNSSASPDSEEIYRKQNGGGFLKKLFGFDSDSEKYVNLTELIIESLDKNDVKTAEFLLNRKFVPDTDMTNNNGENILHKLVIHSNNSQIVSNALSLILNNKNYHSLINKPDNQGYTPFALAIQNGRHDIVSLMAQCGAKRDIGKFNILTDRDTSSSSDSASVYVKIIDFITPNLQKLPEENKINTNTKGKNIFKPQTQPQIEEYVVSNDNDKKLEEIVKGFDTTSTETKLPMTDNIGNHSMTDKKHIDTNTSTETFVSKLAEEMSKSKSNTQPQNELTQMGGANKKNKKNKTKKNKLLARMTKGELSRINEASQNQATEFHKAAIDKVYAILDKKDEYIARAVKAIIYSEIKEKSPQLSGLDKAAELLKMITKDKVNEVLKKKEAINEIVTLLKSKDEKYKTNKHDMNKSKEKGITSSDEMSTEDLGDSDSNSDSEEGVSDASDY